MNIVVRKPTSQLFSALVDRLLAAKAMLDQYMKNAHGFLLVYSITANLSFEAMDKFYEIVGRVHPTTLPLLLTGNKLDLDHDREVTSTLGQEWADKHNTGFIEVSAKDRTNIPQAFEWLVRAIDNWRMKHPDLSRREPPKKKRCQLF